MSPRGNQNVRILDDAKPNLDRNWDGLPEHATKTIFGHQIVNFFLSFQVFDFGMVTNTSEQAQKGGT